MDSVPQGTVRTQVDGTSVNVLLPQAGGRLVLIMKFCRLKQFINAALPIESTPRGRVTDVKLLQPQNVEAAILVTPSGITIDVSELHR